MKKAGFSSSLFLLLSDRLNFFILNTDEADKSDGNGFDPRPFLLYPSLRPLLNRRVRRA